MTTDKSRDECPDRIRNEWEGTTGRIYLLRVALGEDGFAITQYDLACRLGLGARSGEGTICKWEAGTYIPSSSPRGGNQAEIERLEIQARTRKPDKQKGNDNE